MITVDNLRVGNYVKDSYGTIEKLDFLDTLQWLEDEYFGIELNDEIFKRLGFEKRILSTTTYFINHEAEYGLGNKRSGYSYFLRGWKGYPKGVKYVHELQNLHYFLTGVELELKSTA